MNNSWIRPVIRRKDVDKVKKSVKIGDRFIYKTIYKDVEEGTVRPSFEKVVVVKKYPYIVQVVSINEPSRLKSMTYKEILFQKMGLNY